MLCIYKYLFLQIINLFTADANMTNGSYKKKLKAAFKALSIVSPKTEHFGRYCASAILDMEEVDPTIARAIGNWAIDTFGEVYSSKLPLPAMRVLAGGDTRRGYYRNPRITFKGDPMHNELAIKFFPWVEAAEAKLPIGGNPTARAFLNLLKNLRWVILQDSAVLIAVHRRKHFLFNHMKDVFDSDLFRDFTFKLLQHIKKTDEVKDNTIQHVLPGVLHKFDESKKVQIEVLKSIEEHQKNTSIECIEKTVEVTVDRVVNKRFKHFASYLGKYNEHDFDESLDKQSPVQRVGNSPTRAPVNTAAQNHLSPGIELYVLPSSFPTVESILVHWDECIAGMEQRYQHRWRSHWPISVKRRFSRIKNIVLLVKSKVIAAESNTVLEDIEQFYSRKHSIAALADMLRRNK